VVIPRDVLKAARLNPGDAVYLTESDEGEGTLMLVSAALAIQWFQTGRRTYVDRSGS
jgi:bifunctional DNA-binding transcriptional regulator/antitoxin component of YhaV-PrlF toxin-antitoxin module